MSNLSLETVNVDWFDKNALRLPAYKVGRVNFGNGRSYIRINPDGTLENPLRLYTSLTTAISSAAPMERSLLEWHCRLGLQEAERYTKMRQMYGTLLHLEIGKFLIGGGIYDFNTTQEVVEEYTSQHSYWQPECAKWHDELKYDMAAFMQFYFDYKVIPLGIEYVLLSERGFGTLIDLVCRMTISEKGFHGEVYKTGANKGQPKETKQEREITAIINFKSGRHQFYRTNGIQIECERQLWEENFPDLPLDAAYNWSPKEWTSNPGYNLKDWTGDVTREEVDAILKLAEIRYASRATGKEYLTIEGVVSTPEALQVALKRESIEDYCNRKYGVTPVEKAPTRAAFKSIDSKINVYKHNEMPI